MVSTYTPNKNLELPAYNDYVDDWNTPVNADFTDIDTAFGGVTNLSVTAVSGDVTLTATQYRPIQIIIAGTLTANVRYLIPSGKGGQWTVTNNATGAFTVKIASAAGGSDITLQSGTTIVSCDGTAGGMRLSVSNTANVVSTFSAGTTGLTPSSATSGAVTLAGTLGVSNGGTGLTATPTNGQVPIGNGTGYTLSALTAGAGITITNGAGSIIIGSSAGGGTVTSVGVSGGATGLTTSGGPITTSGTITLAGTLGIGYGGTGLTATPTNGQLLIGNGTGYTLANLTAGTGVTITNAGGSITITAASQIQSQLFTANGTWTAPAGVTQARIYACGGGGGGGGGENANCGAYGGNGGQSGAVFGLITVTPGTTYTVTVGQGGAAGNVGTPGNNGSVGGTTSFGALVSCTGGGGGIGGAQAGNANNGTASLTGTVFRNVPYMLQSTPFDGFTTTTATQARRAWTVTSNDTPGVGGGGGSPAGAGGPNAGGGGIDGIVFLEWVG